MNAKGTKKKKTKLPYGDGCIYYVESRNRYSAQINLIIDGKRLFRKAEQRLKNQIFIQIEQTV